MRTINVIKSSLLMLTIAVFAVACKPEPPTPPKQPVEGKCEYTGKFVNGACIPSIYNGYVIFDEKNDRYLAPCESDVPIPMHIKGGEEVSYSYEEISINSECEKQIICAAIPDKPYVFVKITCLDRGVTITQ